MTQTLFGVEYSFTLENYVEFFTSYQLGVFFQTVAAAAFQVVIAVAFGFPIAYYTGIRMRGSKYAFPLLLLFAVPFFVSYILRAMAWIGFLGNQGVFNSALMTLGITDGPIGWFLYSQFAVHVSLPASYIPFVVFPAWLAMARIGDETLSASADLGATPIQTIRHVVLPLSMPGIVIGAVFVFVGVLGESATPVILGGGNVGFVSSVIDNAVNSLNLPLASAISTVMLLMALLVLAIWERIFGLKIVGEI
ncbi:ABC transporter permease [Natrarchaeobius sp. A-rgal3]|uniref:ABC transporter permease n=1 Tax=Natrarchaeobius versutus TaxID=1679078 RepID=UPI00350F737E